MTTGHAQQQACALHECGRACAIEDAHIPAIAHLLPTVGVLHTHVFTLDPRSGRACAVVGAHSGGRRQRHLHVLGAHGGRPGRGRGLRCRARGGAG